MADWAQAGQLGLTGHTVVRMVCSARSNTASRRGAWVHGCGAKWKGPTFSKHHNECIQGVGRLLTLGLGPKITCSVSSKATLPYKYVWIGGSQPRLIQRVPIKLCAEYTSKMSQLSRTVSRSVSLTDGGSQLLMTAKQESRGQTLPIDPSKVSITV